ncbi:GNAT family N-acetyltransferase [Phyllobacterium pellucidum]|uniref:GNAT family N-acetyltransferase n=1 Tax=Phyllobacterium pellucidum TaxID=2740464 RepID=UPI001D154A89|nr:GNAT family N-acetyltransferase [Phyllobacterium sp. T1018]UGY09567.1 GNAT family N-acetyltransferase [Phyllobacterium sp. T1018]
MIVRPATHKDAINACRVLRRSIIELCDDDHANDSQRLSAWLANKTEANVRKWIDAAEQLVVVAEEEGRIMGVGAVMRSGEITLNYVSPEARFRGVSKAMLSQLETYLQSFRITRALLSSTRTAHQFYLSRGYEDFGEPEFWAGMSAQPMVKNLS